MEIKFQAPHAISATSSRDCAFAAMASLVDSTQVAHQNRSNKIDRCVEDQARPRQHFQYPMSPIHEPGHGPGARSC